MNTNKALILVDFINDTVDSKGKVAGKGYADFAERHLTLANAQKLLTKARENNWTVIHVRLSFSTSYHEHPSQSPLFGAAKKFGAFQAGQWGNEFHELLQPRENEIVLQKIRVSAFFDTPLDTILRNLGVNNLYVCGVATDLAVQSTAKDAHDRDYQVNVVSDCCAAANDEDHTQSLRMISKIATIINLNEV